MDVMVRKKITKGFKAKLAEARELLPNEEKANPSKLTEMWCRVTEAKYMGIEVGRDEEGKPKYKESGEYDAYGNPYYELDEAKEGTFIYQLERMQIKTVKDVAESINQILIEEAQRM